MKPKYPIRAFDGTNPGDIRQLTVPEGAIGANGNINLASNSVFNIAFAPSYSPSPAADNTAAVQWALNEVLENDGGTIYFPPGITKLTGVTSLDMNGYEGAIRFTGSQDSVIQLSSTGLLGVFYLANAPMVTVDNLTFIGTGSTGADFTQSLFWFNECGQVHVHDSRFLGIGLTAPEDATFALNKWYGILVGRKTNLVVDNCEFGGCSTLNAPNIGVDDWFSLTIRDTQFVDFGYYADATLSKTGWQTNTYWMRAINGAEPTSTFQRDTVIIENVTCDEGNLYAIFVEDAGNVQLNSVHINAGNDVSASAINIKDVDHATLYDCSVHEANYAATNGINLQNVAVAEVDKLLFTGIVDNFNLTGTTGNVTLKNSTGVTVINTALAAVTNDGITQTSYLDDTITYNTDGTLGDTALSVNLEAGKKYAIDLFLLSTSAAVALLLDFGGTATFTTFQGQWQAQLSDGNPATLVGLNAAISAPGTDFNASALDGAAPAFYRFTGSCEVNAAGTFLLRGSQSASNVSNTTILEGATLTAVEQFNI